MWHGTSKSNKNMALVSLQSRCFLTKTRRYIDRGRHLEKQRKRLRGRGTSPLKSLFDSSQPSGSINVQDGRTTSFLKTIHGSCSKIHLLCRLGTCHQSHLSATSVLILWCQYSSAKLLCFCACLFKIMLVFIFMFESLYSFAKSFKAFMLCIKLLAPLLVISRIIKVEVSVTSWAKGWGW